MKTRVKPPASDTPVLSAGTPPTTDYRLPTTGLGVRKPPGRRRARAEHVAKVRAEQTNRCCTNCVYGVRPAGKLWRLVLLQFPGLLACLNHAETPGQMRDTTAARVCRNFRLRCPPAVRVDPPEPPSKLVCCIPLTKGKHALVDLEDFDRVNRNKWTAYYTGCKWYAGRTQKGKSIRMHRQIMHARKGQIVDHADGNGLNNCKSNLRFCTVGQNNCNRRPGGKSSRYKGVYFDKCRHHFYAVVQYRGKQREFGPFDNEIDAARAYDRMALQYHGAFAYLNFPHEWPPECRGAGRPGTGVTPTHFTFPQPASPPPDQDDSPRSVRASARRVYDGLVEPRRGQANGGPSGARWNPGGAAHTPGSARAGSGALGGRRPVGGRTAAQEKRRGVPFSS